MPPKRSRNTAMRLAAAALLLALPVPRARAETAEEQYAVAAGHYARGRWQLALDEFDAFLTRHGEHSLAATVTFFQGEALVQLERPGRAHERFQHYLQMASAAADGDYVATARFRLGEASTFSQRHERAVRELKSFLERHPDDPRSPHAWMYLGQCQLALNRPQEARDAYLAALEQFGTGELAHQSRFGLARSAELLGETADARRFYRFLIETDSPLADDSLLQTARLLQQEGQLDEALQQVEAFRRTHADSPLRPHLELLAGELLMQLARHAEAAETLSRAAAQYEQHEIAATLAFKTGRAFWLADDESAAETWLAKIEARWPDCPWIDDALHDRVLLSRPADDTIRLGRQFLKRFPDLDSPYRTSVQLAVGEALLKSKQFAAAADQLEAVAGLDAAGPDAWYLLMLALLGANRHHDALAALGQIQQDQLDPALQAGLLVAHASCLFGAEQFGQAVQPLRQYLSRFPDGPDAGQCTAQLAVALAHQGQLSEARDVLCCAPRGGAPDAGAPEGENSAEPRWADRPFFVAAQKFVADHAEQLGRHDVAADLYAGLAKSPTAELDAWIGLAQAHWHSGRRTEAQQALQQLMRLGPDQERVHRIVLAFGQQWSQAGDSEQALACFQWLAERRESAHRSDALYLAARLCEQSGRDRRALQLLDSLEACDPAYPRMDAVLYHRGWALSDLGRRPESRRVFQQLADQHPDSPLRPDAVYRLASMELEDQRPEAAAQHLDGMLATLDRDHTLRTHVLLLRSHAALTSRRWSEAERAARRLLDEHPASELKADAQFCLAESLFRQRQYEQATPLFLAAESASAPDGSSAAPPSWIATSVLRRAQIAAHNKRWPEAAELARQVEQQHPDYPRQFETDYLLGRCHASQARFDEAREAYQRAVDSPLALGTVVAAKAQWMIGETYFHQQRYEAAIRAYHRVELRHDHPEWQSWALLQSAKCHEQLQRWSEAAELYSQVLRDFPATRAAEEARQRSRDAQQRAGPSQPSQRTAVNSDQGPAE